MRIDGISVAVLEYSNSYDSGIEWKVVGGKAQPIDYGTASAHWSASVTLEDTLDKLTNVLEGVNYDANVNVVLEDYEPVFGPEVLSGNTLVCQVLSIGTIEATTTPLFRLQLAFVTSSPASYLSQLNASFASGYLQSVVRDQGKSFIGGSKMEGTYGSDFGWYGRTADVTWYCDGVTAKALRSWLIRSRSTTRQYTSNVVNYFFDRPSQPTQTEYCQILAVGPCQPQDQIGQWFTVTATVGKLQEPVQNEPEPETTYTDPRDGEVYNLVTIGNLTVFKDNFRYNSASSKAYGNNEANVPIYGRLYTNAIARADAPTGWHLMTGAEWDYIVALLSTQVGKKLKANSNLWNVNTGTDTLGFSALPGGFYIVASNTFSGIGDYGLYHLNRLNGFNYEIPNFDATSDDVVIGLGQEGEYGCSVRYVKDA